MILQAIGLLIGMEDVPLEKQSVYLSSLLNPLCQQVEHWHMAVFCLPMGLWRRIFTVFGLWLKNYSKLLFMLLQVEAVLLNAKPHNPEESLPQIENMQQIVMAINALSKVDH